MFANILSAQIECSNAVVQMLIIESAIGKETHGGESSINPVSATLIMPVNSSYA